MLSDIATGEPLLDQKDKKFLDVPAKISIFLILAVIVFFYFFAFTPIEGSSMENNIHDGHYCMVQRKCFEVSRGDIVTIDTSDTKDKHIVVKRVIAVGGDRLLYMKSPDGKHYDLYLCPDGDKYFKLLNENYIKEDMTTDTSIYYENRNGNKKYLTEYKEGVEQIDLTSAAAAEINSRVITVPSGHIYFLGDNRNLSRDSRFYGTRSLDKVTAKVVWVI